MRFACGDNMLNVCLRPVGEDFACVGTYDIAIQILGYDLQFDTLRIGIIAAVIWRTAMLRGYRYGWLVGWLAGWLVGWLAGWLVG